jgi:hypothetical protein
MPQAGGRNRSRGAKFEDAMFEADILPLGRESEAPKTRSSHNPSRVSTALAGSRAPSMIRSVLLFQQAGAKKLRKLREMPNRVDACTPGNQASLVAAQFARGGRKLA